MPIVVTPLQSKRIQSSSRARVCDCCWLWVSLDSNAGTLACAKIDQNRELFFRFQVFRQDDEQLQGVWAPMLLAAPTCGSSLHSVCSTSTLSIPSSFSSPMRQCTFCGKGRLRA